MGGRWFRQRVAAGILLMALAAGCGGTMPSDADTSSCTGDETYFPRGTFPKDYPGADEKRRQWYSATLARLNEPSLSCGADPAETYRLIWLHSLAHPVVIRITRTGEEAELDAFQLSGVGAGDPGVLLYRAQRRLSAVDWGRLRTALEQSHFWSLDTSGNMYGVHGEQWIVEGRRNGSYHIVDRWSPPRGTYRDLGVVFFDLAEWQRPDSTWR